MRRHSIALAVGSFIALACGSGTPAGDDDDDAGGGASGGTSPNGGVAGSGLSGTGGSAGASSGGAGASGGSAGTSGSSTSGSGGLPTGGQSGAGTSGSAGSGGSGAGNTGEWSCDTDDVLCACDQIEDHPLSACGGSWSCCVYWVDEFEGVEYEHCACDNATDAQCMTRVNGLAASSQGRRESNCPP